MLTRCFSALIVFLIFADVSSIDAQDDTRPTATWQVVKYDIAATLPQADTDRNLTSKAKLDLKNVSSRPATTLTLRINQAAVVSTVTVNGTAVDFTKSEEKIGTGSLQRIALRVPPVQPEGSLSATIDYKIPVAENSGLHSLSPAGSQFLPLSFWYPTPNSWYFARGADYGPFRITVTAPGQTVVSSGVEASGGFDQKLPAQPFFLTGSWDTINANGISVLVPKGAGAEEQKVAGELSSFASEAKAFVEGLLGPAPDVPIRLVAVRRAGGFTGGGTILIDDGVFRRGRLDSQTAMSVADAIAKVWLGNGVIVSGDGSGVIREGLTKYLATQFIERKFGKEIADVERQRQRVAYSAVSRRDSPLTIVSALDDYYYPEVANKGAMVWRIIHRKIGNDEFYKAVRSSTQDGTISLSEIRAQFPAEKELLDYLFDQVTETNLLAGLPQAVGSDTRIALRNTGPIDVTVNVSVLMANGERLSAPSTVRANSFGEVTFKTASKVNRVEIDPDKLYPQTDYSDDVAPREATDNDLLLAVKRFFDKQEFANAERTARTVLRDFPRFDDVRILLARSLLALGRTADAEREFRLVLDEKIPSSRSIAWANVGLADIAQRANQSTQAMNFASKAIEADGEYGASLAARAIRNKLNATSGSDDGVKAFFTAFDKAAVANRKAELEAMSVPGEVGRFVSGLSGQVAEWKTHLTHVDRIDANSVWAEAVLTIRLLNRDAETGMAVYRLTRAGGTWKLSSVDIFEVR
jgi:tetratricopeptide (TPR) repeat protein